MESVEYLAKTWVDPHKEKFVRERTNSIQHFGHTVTLREEGAHNVVKEFIAISMVNPFGYCERIIRSNESSLTEPITVAAITILPFTQPTPRGDIFHNINQKVSYYALWSVFRQVRLSYSLLPMISFQSLTFLNDSWKRLGVP